MKVKFISNNPHYHSPGRGHPKGEWCVVNNAYFALRHWYSLYGLHRDRVEWQVPDIVCTVAAQEQLEQIMHDPPDVLALAVFVWNEHTQHWLAQRYKQLCPHGVVVMGGPQLRAHREPDFFDRYPWVDWAVYGDGEKPFQQILDILCDPDSVPESQIRNAVRRVEGVHRCYPYEIMSDHLYLSTSMWTPQRQEILRVLDHITASGIPRSRVKFTVEWARGCMYNCTFCDWSQNLTSKVKRRRHDWRQELELFHELDIPIRETDANFGQWAEDLEIFEHANSLTRPDRNFYFIPKNTPKIKKSSIMQIMKRCFEVHGAELGFQEWALQDPDTAVLEAVDRPSIPFSEICDMVKEINQQFHGATAQLHTAQLIVGLPQQSLDTWCHSIQRIWNEAEIKNLNGLTWEFLPNSPANTPEYVSRHEIRTRRAYIVNHTHDCDSASLDQLYQRVGTDVDLNHRFSSTHLVCGTATMSDVDSLAARYLLWNIGLLCELRRTRMFRLSDHEMQKLKLKSLRDASRANDLVSPYLDRYGFLLLGSRNEHDGTLSFGSLPLLPWDPVDK